jgi:hypothetical protein
MDFEVKMARKEKVVGGEETFTGFPIFLSASKTKFSFYGKLVLDRKCNDYFRIDCSTFFPCFLLLSLISTSSNQSGGN